MTPTAYSARNVLNAFCAQPHSISRSLRKKVLPHSPLWKKGRESHGQSPGEKTEELRCDFSTQSPPPELLITPHTYTHTHYHLNHPQYRISAPPNMAP